MKDYKPTYPNPNDDDRPEAEKQNGEGARPSSLVAVHRTKVIDPLHELNLLRMMQVATDRTTRELGPLPPGGLPVPDKRKPTAPYVDFLGRVVPDVLPIVEENDEMRLKQMAVTVLAVGTAACNPATPMTGSAYTSTTGKAATSITPAFEQIDAQEKHTMLPLQSLLNVFATPNVASWSTFNPVPGVHWHDAKPLDNLNATEPDVSHYRSGTLLLSGFGEVDVPDGKIGAEAGARKDNEGNVGVTLNGGAESVQSIALLKFYPSKNYQEILQNQFNGSVIIKVIADTCTLDYGTTAPNTQMNVFYQIDMGSHTIPVFAEAYVDEGGGNQGPGYTYFVFYRDKPQKRLAAMRCKER